MSRNFWERDNRKPFLSRERFLSESREIYSSFLLNSKRSRSCILSKDRHCFPTPFSPMLIITPNTNFTYIIFGVLFLSSLSALLAIYFNFNSFLFKFSSYLFFYEKSWLWFPSIHHLLFHFLYTNSKRKSTQFRHQVIWIQHPTIHKLAQCQVMIYSTSELLISSSALEFVQYSILNTKKTDPQTRQWIR